MLGKGKSERKEMKKKEGGKVGYEKRVRGCLWFYKLFKNSISRFF